MAISLLHISAYQIVFRVLESPPRIGVPSGPQEGTRTLQTLPQSV